VLRKLEIRRSKYEGNPKLESRKPETARTAFVFVRFRVSDFEFRASR